MEAGFKALRPGERVDVDALGSQLVLTLGRGRGSSAILSGEQNLVLALRGDLHLETSDGAANLAPGSLLVASPGRIRVALRQGGLWIALSGSLPTWRAALRDAIPSAGEREPVFYPDCDRCVRSAKRALVRLARAMRREDSGSRTQALLSDALARLWESQRGIDELNRRCPGRSLARRRQNLLRLVRVRHWIAMNPAARIQLAALAESANYSPWHFIRSFREVFGETPVEYAIRARMEHARYLIGNSELSITEVAGAVGYDSRSAFCRSFRQIYGMSASEARRRCAEPAAARRKA
jgi:AraC family transcriptional regulator